MATTRRAGVRGLLWLALCVPAIGEAQRRPIRVDAGAWAAPQTLASPACPLDLTGTARLLQDTLLFSGLPGDDLLAGASCQSTEPGAYAGSAYAPGEEDGLAALLGPNADGVATAVRYTFANDADVLSATRAFQWYTHRLGDLVLVSLHLSVDGSPNVALDDSTHLLDLSTGERLWGAGTDGFDGEYFCFRLAVASSLYLGRWNGREDDPGSYCLDYIKYASPLRPQVASRDGRGVFLGAAAGDAAFATHHRFVAYARVTAPITIHGPRHDVFEFDRALGTTRQLNRRSDGDASDAGAFDVAMSPEPFPAGDGDGRWIAFASRATDLPRKIVIAGDTSEVFLEGPGETGRTPLQRLTPIDDTRSCHSPTLGTPPPDLSYGYPSPRVVYACHDLADGSRPSLWSYGEDGETAPLWTGEPGQQLGAPRLSRDGRVLVFSTDAPIDPADGNLQRDVYALVLATGAFERISRPPAGGDANGSSDAAVPSDDGCRVAFQSGATNLVAGSPAAQAVFVRDRCRDTLELASRGLDGAPLAGENALPSLSGDGDYVAFQTDDAALRSAAALSGPGTTVVVRRLGQAAQTRVVQTASIAGSAFVRSASHPVLSIENTSVGSGRGTFGPDEAGHELLVRVTPDDGEPQLAVVDSPFPRTYVPVFGDGFD